MPRNASGTYTLPTGNPVVSGDIISSTWANDTMGDVASALTNSLSRDGSGGMTAALRVVDGSVSVPGLAFGNETGSGLYRAAAGDVGLAILGNQILRMRSTGLDVTGAVGVSGNLAFTGTGNRITGDFSNATLSNRVLFQTSTANSASIVGVIPSGTGTISQIAIYGGSDPSNAQATRIDVRGGTESRIESTYAGTPTSGTYLPMTFFTGGSERVRIATSGNVGIGLTSPSYVLDVQANPIRVAALNSGAGYIQYGKSSDATYNWHVGSEGNGSFRFYNGNFGSGTLRMTLDSSGNLLVGSTFGGSTALRLAVKGSGSTSATSSIYVENSSGTGTFRVRDDGAIVTGNASLSPYNLTTGNAANVFVESGGILYRSTSSIKYKTNVQDANFGLADVLKLRPVTYKGKNDGSKVFGGLIAEEVHDAGLTEFVQYAEDGSPDALAYGNMVALAFKAIQELKAEVDALKAAAV